MRTDRPPPMAFRNAQRSPSAGVSVDAGDVGEPELELPARGRGSPGNAPGHRREDAISPKQLVDGVNTVATVGDHFIRRSADEPEVLPEEWLELMGLGSVRLTLSSLAGLFRH